MPGGGKRGRQRGTYLLILIELRQLPRPDLVGLHAGAMVCVAMDGCGWYGCRRVIAFECSALLDLDPLSSHSRKRVEESEAHKLPQHKTAAAAAAAAPPITSTVVMWQEGGHARCIDTSKSKGNKGGSKGARSSPSPKSKSEAASACVVFLLVNLRRFFLQFCFDYNTMQAKVFQRLFEAFFAFVVFAASFPPSARDSQLHAPGIHPYQTTQPQAELGDELYLFQVSSMANCKGKRENALSFNW